MLWKLFKATFIISAFTFGGGYVIVPMMQKKFVEEYQWIDEDEMLDLVAIAQSTPGAIAINTSVALGYKIKGVLGAIVATVATALPPMVILMSVQSIYEALKGNIAIEALLQGMQAGVCAIILNVVVRLIGGLKKQRSFSAWTVFIVSIILNVVCRVNLLVIICVMTLFSVLGIKLEEKWVNRETS